MSKKSYAELLRDPRWQKKRLAVMSREDFSCQMCGNKSETLNVHHAYYEKGKMPWEYPDASMHCLCEVCHDTRGKSELRLQRLIALLDDEILDRVIGYATALVIARSEFNIMVDSPFIEEGVADAWGISPLLVRSYCVKGKINGSMLHDISLASDITPNWIGAAPMEDEL